MTMSTPDEAPEAEYTVVISTFNRARFLRESIQSLLSQTRPPHRVVVVSDGCTDDTASVVRSFGRLVELVELSNGGKARALNHVLPSIKTEFCWFFDDDDLAYPEAAAALHDALRRKPMLGFSFGSWDVAWSEGELSTADAQAVPYPFAGLGMQEQAWQLYRRCTVMMTGALLRTACVRAVGGLNEDLIRGQDYDLMVRLASRFGFAYCQRSVYRWRQHQGHRGASGQQHGSADRLAVWAKASEPVGTHLRDHLALSDWSTRGLDEPACRREALIRQAWALAPKQAIKATVAALQAAFGEDATSALSATERQLLHECCSHDFMVYRGPLKLLALARLPVGKASADALAAIARGLWWLARGEPAIRTATLIRISALGLLAAGGWLRLLAPRAP